MSWLELLLQLKQILHAVVLIHSLVLDSVVPVKSVLLVLKAVLSRGILRNAGRVLHMLVLLDLEREPVIYRAFANGSQGSTLAHAQNAIRARIFAVLKRRSSSCSSSGSQGVQYQ